MLCEIPVVVTAVDFNLLTPAIEAIHSLIYPFRWPYIYIPLLPKQLASKLNTITYVMFLILIIVLL
jgi:hypothetical protein